MEERRRSSNGRGADATPRLNEALRHVDAGRKLVIYERTTGLFAHWYISLRCEEECYRAQRYERPLALLALEPARDDGAFELVERVAETLMNRMRRADLPGYFGNARFALVMPETDQAAAGEVLKRLCNDVPGILGGMAGFPQDGLTFEQLYNVAARRIRVEDFDEPDVPDPVPFRRIERPDWPGHGLNESASNT